jgi:hypothetical protein
MNVDAIKRRRQVRQAVANLKTETLKVVDTPVDAERRDSPRKVDSVHSRSLSDSGTTFRKER